MVKSSGRLLPDLLSEEERNQLPEKMQMLRDIIFSTWPACTQPDPDDPDHTPFVAEAIISNPVSYGHVHCAEALAVPLVRKIFLLLDSSYLFPDPVAHHVPTALVPNQVIPPSSLQHGIRIELEFEESSELPSC